MDFDQKPLVAGVAPGGFTDAHEVRILICYLLDSTGIPMSKENLNYIFQINHLVNYFTFSEALTELIQSKHISVQQQGKEEFYRLNPLGKETAKLLKNSLPRSVRDRVVSTAMELMVQLKKEEENEALIEPYKNGYRVHCIIHDDDIDLIEFKLFVPDKMQADIVREQFLRNPTHFYSKMIAYLTEKN